MENINDKIEQIYDVDFCKELFRKTLHMLIAFVPFIASYNLYLSIYTLAFLTIFYIFSELMRQNGLNIVFFTNATKFASRKRDLGKFVMGPVTLLVGSTAALLIFPKQQAFFAIFALAFGDGISSVIGRRFGSIKLPFTKGKTLEGSLACFVMVFLISYKMSSSFVSSLYISLFVAMIEAIPSGDYDNIMIPIAAGLSSGYLLF